MSKRMEKARPLFLVGPPRSGTTLMTRILNAHPQVLLTNETAVFMQVAEMVKNSRIGRKAGVLFGKNSGDVWADVLESNADHLFRTFYSRLAEEQNKDELVYWGEKHPHINKALEFIDHLYPDAMYVYAIRDPRDSACSISQMNNVPVSQALETWGKFSRRYERLAASLPAERLVRVRYEDLVADYDGESEKLFNALGLEFHERARHYVREYKNVDSHSGVAKAAADEGRDARGGLRSAVQDYQAKSLARWEREMGEADRRKAVQLHGEFLDRYHYVREGKAASPVQGARSRLARNLKAAVRRVLKGGK